MQSPDSAEAARDTQGRMVFLSPAENRSGCLGGEFPSTVTMLAQQFRMANHRFVTASRRRVAPVGNGRFPAHRPGWPVGWWGGEPWDLDTIRSGRAVPRLPESAVACRMQATAGVVGPVEDRLDERIQFRRPDCWTNRAGPERCKETQHEIIRLRHEDATISRTKRFMCDSLNTMAAARIERTKRYPDFPSKCAQLFPRSRKRLAIRHL